MEQRKVPLTDNNIIEQELGKFGIVCIEDMVHQIYNAGPHFKEVVRFMWPFELNKPAEGLKGSKTSFKEDGDTGNREDLINELINKMNQWLLQYQNFDDYYVRWMILGAISDFSRNQFITERNIATCSCYSRVLVCIYLYSLHLLIEFHQALEWGGVEKKGTGMVCCGA